MKQVNQPTIPLRKRIPTLSILAKSRVSDLLVSMLCNDSEYTENDIEGVCTILSNLGLLPSLVESVLDALCDSEAPSYVWDRALCSVINYKTTSLKIKPGWMNGESLLSSLIQMKRLGYLDITGICWLSRNAFDYYVATLSR